MTARARESNLWSWLSRAEADYPFYWRRVEDSINRGTADVLGVVNSRGLAIELKSVARPARGGPVWCELKREQAMFLRAWHRAGGAAGVLVQVGTGAAAARYFVSARRCVELLEPVVEAELCDMSLTAAHCRPIDVLRAAREI